jgi:hypothetical protein
MIEVTLHPTPRWRDVAFEQVRIVGLGLRREALIALIVLGIATIPIVSELARGGPGFDSHAMFPTTVAAFLFPFAVWRREPRFGPAFLWTLPVDRRRLALAKVLAGWVWMMAALMVFVSWLLALALVAGAPPVQILMRVPLIASTGMYLLGSAFVLGLRHPLRWLLGTFGVFFLLTMFNETLGRTPTGEWRIVAWSGVLRWLVYGPYGVRALLGAIAFFPTVERVVTPWQTLPPLAQWAIATFLWLGAGLIALWAALSRHAERRRH